MVLAGGIALAKKQHHSNGHNLLGAKLKSKWQARNRQDWQQRRYHRGENCSQPCINGEFTAVGRGPRGARVIDDALSGNFSATLRCRLRKSTPPSMPIGSCSFTAALILVCRTDRGQIQRVVVISCTGPQHLPQPSPEAAKRRVGAKRFGLRGGVSDGSPRKVGTSRKH
jgi:hypothetical protein